MSQSKTPLVHEVIPIFDIIAQALDDYVDDATLPPAVRMAAVRGQAMLNKYYGLTDNSIVYQIAMHMLISAYGICLLLMLCVLVLHPRYKSSYFHKAGWPREWITTAEELLRTEWNTNYKVKAVPTESTPIVVTYSHYVRI